MLIEFHLFVQIVPDGAASKTTLGIGDRILSVNGKDVTRASHQEAVMALIAPTYEIVLDIRHDPPPPGLKVIELGLFHLNVYGRGGRNAKF